MYGWKPTELIGRNVVQSLSHETNMELGEAIMTKLKLGEAWKGAFQCRHRDGRKLDIFATDYPIFDPSRKLIGIVGVSCLANARRTSPLSTFVSTV